MAEDKNNQAEPLNEAVAIPKPTLTIDWVLYAEHLDNSDLSDAEKRAFLETLWSIVVSFVDMGFGVHTVQQAGGNSCAQSAEIQRFITAERDDVLGSIHPKPTFNAAGDVSHLPAKGSHT